MTPQERSALIAQMNYDQMRWWLDWLARNGTQAEAEAYMGWPPELASDFCQLLTSTDFISYWTRLLPSHPLNNVNLPGVFTGNPLTVHVTVADGMNKKSVFQLLMNPTFTLPQIQAYLDGFLPLVDALIEGVIVGVTITLPMTMPSGLKSASLPTADVAERLSVTGVGLRKTKLHSGHFALPTIRPDVLELSVRSGYRILDPVNVPEAQAFLQWWYDPPTPQTRFGQVGHARSHPPNKWHGIDHVQTQMRYTSLRRYRQ